MMTFLFCLTKLNIYAIITESTFNPKTKKGEEKCKNTQAELLSLGS